MENKMNTEEDGIVQGRIEKLRELKEMNIDAFPYRWEKKDGVKELRERFGHLKEEEESGYSTCTAGRLIGKRRQGKAGFGNIADGSEKIQIYCRQDVLGDSYEIFKKADIGDFIGITGNVFKTKTGELTILVKGFSVLAKSLKPLPEKWHGLKDIELIYRKRYLDLISNGDSFDIFLKRTKIIKSIRKYLDSKGFIEVETPILQTLPGGADARPFVTHHNALDMELYLRIAPELYLKRLIIGGFERVYELNRNFRNEGMDKNHNPEFTMLETYAAYWDYNDVMDFTEGMIKTVVDEVFGGTVDIVRDGRQIPLSFPFKRISMLDELSKVSGLDIASMNEDELISKVKELGKEAPRSKGKAIEKLFEHYVEPSLNKPVFITDFPIESSPLTKKHRSREGVVERFELYFAGMEIANAYSELNDPLEQKERFEMQEALRTKGDDEAQRMDEDFLEALHYGMPPTGGLGIGVDRLVMILTNAKTIRDVILFPTMRKEAE